MEGQPPGNYEVLFEGRDNLWRVDGHVRMADLGPAVLAGVVQ